MCTLKNRNFYKANNEPAIAAIAYIKHEDGRNWIAPLLVSTSESAVAYTTSDSGSTIFNYKGTFDYHGTLFYYSASEYWYSENSDYSNASVPRLNSRNEIMPHIDAAKKLLDDYFSKRLPYLTDGLILHYDGIKNTGTNHSPSTTIWRDLSENGHDGAIQGATWSEDCLTFDGIDDWVSLGEMNYPNITLEIVAVCSNATGAGPFTYIGNFEYGGYGIEQYPNKNANTMSIFLNTTYTQRISNNSFQKDKKYSLSGVYDTSTLSFFENGQKVTGNTTGNLGFPRNNTVMAIGANPAGSKVTGGYLKGNVYSARIYNRALTDEEVRKNYEIDKIRFGVE